MMKITIIAVGKIKEKFYKDAIDEYVKRIGKYGKINIIEVKDEKTGENQSHIENVQIKKIESERIIKHINLNDCICTLEIKGEVLSSEELSQYMQKQGVQGISHMQFIIGGSIGLHENISKLAHKKLSFSAMTFPHQLMRVILCEQIYRSYRIMTGEPYHK